MKITKSFLKQIIKEELEKIEEDNNLPLDPIQIKKQKEELQSQIALKQSQVTTKTKEINQLRQEIADINKQLASMGG